MTPERGIFVNVVVTEACTYSQGCRACLEVCPVDIFAAPGDPAAVGGERLPIAVRGQLEDECTLCNLCTDRCPPRALEIRRLYLQV